MRYMLDTNTCIYTMKRQPPEVKRRLAKIPIGEVGISGIVAAELWYGVTQSARKKHNEESLAQFLEFLAMEDWPAEAAPEYARMRSHLRKEGTPIGAMDLLIASHAVVRGAMLVSDNLREFRRVPGLRVESWVSR